MTDMEKLQGKWRAVSGEKYGEKLSAEDLKPIVAEIVFAGDKLSFAAGDAKLRPFKIDPSKKPKEIDLYRGEGFVPAIYELEGNTLKICFPQADPSDPPGVNIFIGRPKVMAGTGPLRYVIRFERVVVREIDLKGYGALQPKNGFAIPTKITSAAELANAFPDEDDGLPGKEWRQRIAGQVDFTKEHLLFFAWSGTRYDKILIRGEETKQVVFRRQPGITNEFKAHFHLYAISKDATWRLEDGNQRPDDKPKGDGESGKQLPKAYLKQYADSKVEALGTLLITGQIQVDFKKISDAPATGVALDFGNKTQTELFLGSAELVELARSLHGKRVIVTGELELVFAAFGSGLYIEGVLPPHRKIIKVTSLKPA